MMLFSIFTISFLFASVSAAVTFDYSAPETEWCANIIAGSVCCSGMDQSPIDISSTSDLRSQSGRSTSTPASGGFVDAGFSVTFNQNLAYLSPQNGTLKNDGSTIKFEPDNGDAMILSGGTLGSNQYKVVNVHLHWPSEHTLDGQSFLGEIHVVHQNILGTSDFVVLGYFLKDTTGVPSPFLDTIINNGDPLTEIDATTAFTMNLNILRNELPANSGLANYQGSLTTPNCDEVVNWHVFLKPIQATAGQIVFFEEIQGVNADPLLSNNRPVQPLNNRVVVLYK